MLAAAPGWQVKRLDVLPGHRLSLQSHQHRSEFWKVLQGTAMVDVDDVRVWLWEGDTRVVEVGQLHRLENTSATEPLVVLETQRGDYLGEDDIVRYDDDYGRS